MHFPQRPDTPPLGVGTCCTSPAPAVRELTGNVGPLNVLFPLLVLLGAGSVVPEAVLEMFPLPTLRCNDCGGCGVCDCCKRCCCCELSPRPDVELERACCCGVRDDWEAAPALQARRTARLAELCCCCDGGCCVCCDGCCEDCCDACCCEGCCCDCWDCVCDCEPGVRKDPRGDVQPLPLLNGLAKREPGSGRCRAILGEDRVGLALPWRGSLLGANRGSSVPLLAAEGAL